MNNRHIGWLFCIFTFAASLVSAQTAPSKQHADTIISGGMVVTMDAQRRVYDDGAVAVKGDTIVAVGPRAEIEAKYESAQTVTSHLRPRLPPAAG